MCACARAGARVRKRVRARVRARACVRVPLLRPAVAAAAAAPAAAAATAAVTAYVNQSSLYFLCRVDIGSWGVMAVVKVVVVTVNGGSLLCTAGTQTDGQIFGDFINPQRSRNLEHDRTSKLFRKAMSTTTVGYALFCSCLLLGRPQEATRLSLCRHRKRVWETRRVFLV